MYAVMIARTAKKSRTLSYIFPISEQFCELVNMNVRGQVSDCRTPDMLKIVNLFLTLHFEVTNKKTCINRGLRIKSLHFSLRSISERDIIIKIRGLFCSLLLTLLSNLLKSRLWLRAISEHRALRLLSAHNLSSWLLPLVLVF